jgi:hypothetical protein
MTIAKITIKAADCAIGLLFILVPK